MAAATSVVVNSDARQFRGLFKQVWVVRFTLDVGSIGSNGTDESTVAVPGLKAGDIVLGFSQNVEPGTDVVHELHVTADDVLHVVTHNRSGGSFDPASASWTVIVVRV